MESKQPEHLIIQTAFLGDLLLGIPFFKELRARRPGDKLTLFCRQGLGDFFVRAGLVDEVVEADKSSRSHWKSAVEKLKNRKFELLFCPHESTRSATLVFSLNARLKIGYRSWFNRWLFHQRVARPMELPEALRQLALLTPVFDGWSERLERFTVTQKAPGGRTSSGELVDVPAWAGMALPSLAKIREQFKVTGEFQSMSSERVRAIAKRLDLVGRRVVFLAPGSVWPTKMWTADGYTRLARELLASGARVIVTGAPDEKETCSEIAFRAKGAVSIAGEASLYESAELFALADLLVCNDSGAMHIGAAADVPTVAIFGPTVLDFGYRPWQNQASVVEVPRAQLACRPCGKHGASVCPLGTHECMKRVSPEEVMKKVSERICEL